MMRASYGIGVAILAVGISGIQQFGGSFWVEPLFNGVTLLIAIGMVGLLVFGVFGGMLLLFLLGVITALALQLAILSVARPPSSPS